ncbi:S8/S53 family peptidase [Spongiactinospora sp. TRM90649]|uniref:S8 family peptidase n=1 Tax=Spongiactinospora sp. TRM90649 TaxID=3031114 RepID=UPI0023F66C2A|nr:S8/S53 family peptidase [Spongiactinospora sp. TRM90649]MDF5753812.1 S8/S53 family peptidase [Spongiactinospora sp. TRM90649]
MSEPAFQPEKFLTQFAFVREQMLFSGRSIDFDPPDHRSPSYVYEADHVLVAEEDTARRARLTSVISGIPGVDALVPTGDGAALSDGPPDAPVARYRVESSSGLTVPRLLDEVDERMPENREQPMVTPNHVLTIAGVYLCPEDEPIPMRTAVPYPAPLAASGPHPVSVRVVDTGLVPDHEKLPTALSGGGVWVQGIDGGPRLPFDPEDIPLYVGHGTFIGGIVGCLAPSADIYVANDLRFGGAVTEWDLYGGLARAAGPGPVPDIISLSAGTTTRNALPPPGMTAIIRRIEESFRRTGAPLLVAAAGNNASTEPLWPAGFAADFESVLSVGALAQAQPPRRACFSNHGPWVKVYASGEKLVNVFPDGHYRHRHAPSEICTSDALTPGKGETRCFNGDLARWSGTSFATPLVAGLIARRMARTGQTARQATSDVMAFARSQAGAGPLPAVLTADNEIV